MKNKIVKMMLLAATIITAAAMPVTAFAQSKENEAVVEEVGEDGKPFSVPGNGQLLDDITDDSTKQFITVQTKNNQTFFMVIDRAQSTENVYMLSLIDEDDLSEFLKEANAKDTGVVLPGAETEKSEPEHSATDLPEKTVESEKKDNTTTMLILVGIIFAVAIGAGYYIKVYKPKKEAAEDQDEGIEDDGYEEEYDTDEYEDDSERDDPEEYEEDGYEDPEDEAYDEKEYEEGPEPEEEEETEEAADYEIESDDVEDSEEEYYEAEDPEEEAEPEPEPESKPEPKKQRGHGRKNRLRYSR